MVRPSKLKPWLAARSVPEPKDLNSLFGFIQTINNKVISVNNPANPTVASERSTAPRQLGKRQGCVQQVQSQSFRGSSIIACDISYDPKKAI